MAQLFISRAAR